MTISLPRRSAEQVLDRASARRFVAGHIAGSADAFDRRGDLPESLFEAMAEAGLWAPFLSADQGGAGVSYATLGSIHEEVGRGCSSVRSLLTVHTMVSFAISRWGSQEQRQRWLPELASGRVQAAICVSEYEAGSDTGRIGTTARRTDRGWVLDGTKTWITAGRRAGLFLVFARTGSTIAAFLVPRDTSGVEITPIDGILGTRASLLATVGLRDAELGPEALLGPENFAAGMLLAGTLDMGRFSVAAGSVGIVQACLDACAAYTTGRMVGDSRLRDLQLIRAKMADMVTDVTAGRLLYEHAGRLKDSGNAETIMATWIAKYFASTAAARHAAEAVQIHGAHGCGPEYPVARYFRDAKIMEIIEGSSEIQRLTIAEAAYRRSEP
ncbi:acyl-CoA dehydrogenase family protein [Nonomuraea sp. NPDC049695]|uniref:acyl-CoA dehydrogenase family protein n=1 Tax=Nonomuraea sp. NPDC049695 TaxID=3154734 RepID=UPI003423E10D